MERVRDKIQEALEKAQEALTDASDTVDEIERQRQQGHLTRYQREDLDIQFTRADKTLQLATESNDALDDANTELLRVEDEVALLKLDAGRWRKTVAEDLIVICDGYAPFGDQVAAYVDKLEASKDEPHPLRVLLSAMKACGKHLNDALKGHESQLAYGKFEADLRKYVEDSKNGCK